MQSFLRAMRSAMSSFVGVQSEQRRAEDFENGRPIHFIVSGIVLTAIFIATVMLVVQGALSMASK